MSEDALDQTGAKHSQLDFSDEPPTETAQPKVVSSEKAKKKGMSAVFKILLTVLFLFIIIGAGFAWLIFQSQSQAPISGFGPVMEQANTSAPLTTETEAIGGSNPAGAGLFKQVSPAAPEETLVAVLPTKTLQAPEPVSNPAEHSALAEYAFTDPPSHDMESEADMYASVLDIVTGLKKDIAQHEQTFRSFDIAATALHKRHQEQIDILNENSNRKDNAIMDLKRELIALNEQVKAMETKRSKPVDDALLEVAKVTKQFEDAIGKIEKNYKDINWISFTRLCSVEKQLGQTRWAKYCRFDETDDKVQSSKSVSANAGTSILATAQPRPTDNPSEVVQMPRLSTNSEVPLTVGQPLRSLPIANVVQGVAKPVDNPCIYANREWKLSLISPSQALLHRNMDGYETVVDVNTRIPELGRVQMFNSNGYPQYVQFTNAIVCGG